MNKNELVIKEETNNVLINEYFKQNRDYKVSFVEIGNTKNLSGYILIKKNEESVGTARKRKKAKDYYLEVSFAGLSQLTKEISISTYTVLNSFINRFKIDSMDICFDGLSNIDINSENLYRYLYLFRGYIDSFSDTHREETSFYINSPKAKESDTDRFKKILVYDKYIKESRYKKISDELENWKRLEFTLNVKFKFKGFNLDDYLEDMKETAFIYFEVSSFSYDYVELQKKLLIDKRTHRGLTSL